MEKMHVIHDEGQTERKGSGVARGEMWYRVDSVDGHYH